MPELKHEIADAITWRGSPVDYLSDAIHWLREHPERLQTLAMGGLGKKLVKEDFPGIRSESPEEARDAQQVRALPAPRPFGQGAAVTEREKVIAGRAVEVTLRAIESGLRDGFPAWRLCANIRSFHRVNPHVAKLPTEEEYQHFYDTGCWPEED